MQSETSLRVGTARRCITPDRPVYLSGYGGRDQLSEGAYRDLFVTAAYLEGDGGRVALVAADLLQFGATMVHEIKRRAESLTGLAADQVLLNASHTHCGPAIDEPSQHLYPAVDADYVAWAIESCAQAVAEAARSPEPATLQLGTSVASFGVNRRRLTEEGMSMVPNPRGACDPEVAILWAADEQGQPKVVIFSYACHPTTMSGYLMGGDYPALARELIEQELEGATSLFLQGCCGDVRPRTVGAGGRFVSGTVQDVEAFGRELGRAVLTGMAVPVCSVGGTVATDLRTVGLPLQEIKHCVTATIQSVRMGDFALIGLSGECCVGYQLRLKQARAPRPTLVSAYCNDMCCYVPTASMIPEGGYEVLGSLECYRVPGPFSPEAEDLFVSAALDSVCESL